MCVDCRRPEYPPYATPKQDDFDNYGKLSSLSVTLCYFPDDCLWKRKLTDVLWQNSLLKKFFTVFLKSVWL